MRVAILVSVAVAVVLGLQGLLLWRVIELDHKAEQLSARVHAALQGVRP